MVRLEVLLRIRRWGGVDYEAFGFEPLVVAPAHGDEVMLLYCANRLFEPPRVFRRLD